MLALLMSLVAAADPLVIEAPDASEVLVVCGHAPERRLPVRSGRVELPQAAGDCTVRLVVDAGTLAGTGAWRCTSGGCVSTEERPPVKPAKPGELIVHLAQGAQTTGIEVTCPDGYRSRAAFVENTATLTDLPDDECTVSFKGGPPARYRPVRYGSWDCHLEGTTAVCRRLE